MTHCSNPTRLFLQACSLLSFLVLTSVTASAKEYADDMSTIVATVNGEGITMADWVRRMENLRYTDFILSTSPITLKPDTGGKVALETLINGRMILQYAKKVGLLPTEAEVTAGLEEAKKLPAVIEGLKNNAFTEAQMRDDVQLQRAFVNVVTINQRVSPEEAKAYYDRHTELHGKPEIWGLRLIRADGKASLDKIQDALKRGIAFDKVASDFSDDLSTRKSGGDIGMVNASAAGIPDFIKEPVRKMKIGDVSAPILSKISTPEKPVYFIVKLTARNEGTVQTFDQIKAQIEKQALMEKVGGGQLKLEELRKDAVIVINIPRYQNIFKK
jgi:parvulin-like peptidyl-prolyl isomerase